MAVWVAFGARSASRRHRLCQEAHAVKVVVLDQKGHPDGAIIDPQIPTAAVFQVGDEPLPDKKVKEQLCGLAPEQHVRSHQRSYFVIVAGARRLLRRVNVPDRREQGDGVFD